MTVWIIVRNERQTYGHGDYGTCDVVVKTGDYDSGPPRPGFTSLAIEIAA